MRSGLLRNVCLAGFMAAAVPVGAQAESHGVLITNTLVPETENKTMQNVTGITGADMKQCLGMALTTLQNSRSIFSARAVCKSSGEDVDYTCIKDTGYSHSM